MPFTQPWFEVDFGAAYDGIATTGYRLYKNDGTDSVVRTITGVVDLGEGGYGVPAVNVPDDAVGIEWDTGGGSPVYAREDVEPYRDRANMAADIWGEALPGAFGEGTAGYLVGAYLDLEISEVSVEVWQADPADHTDPDTFGRLLGATLVADVQDARFMDGVFISDANGSPGTAYDLGTRGNPVSGTNLVNASTIAATRGQRRFNFLDDSVYTLGQAYDDWTFEGETVPIINMNGQSLSGSIFSRCYIYGTGSPTGVFEGFIASATISTMAFRSVFSLTIVVNGGTYYQCFFDEATITVGASFEIRDGSGVLNLAGQVGGTVRLDNFQGLLVIESSCTGGQIKLTGAGVLINQANGTAVDASGFQTNEDKIAARTQATAGSTATNIRTGLTQVNDFFNNMQVVVINAAGVAVRNINDFVQVNGVIIVDDLPFTPAAGNVVLVLSKTGSVPLDTAVISTALWSEGLPGAFGVGEAGYILGTNLDALISSRAAPGADMGLTGTALDAVADYVWDELIAGHLGGDKAGQHLEDADATADPTAVAQAVWQQEFAGYTTDTQMGWLMNKYLRALIIGDAYQDQAAKQWVIYDPDDGLGAGATELARHNTYGAGGALANARIYKRQKI